MQLLSQISMKSFCELPKVVLQLPKSQKCFAKFARLGSLNHILGATPTKKTQNEKRMVA